MQKTELQNFLFDRKELFPEIENRITKDYLLERKPTQNRRWILLDSFDWRLYNNNCYLCFSNSELSLFAFEDSLPIARLHSAKRPSFADDLPDSLLKDQLKKYIADRALFPRGEFEENLYSYSLLNKDKKTIAWLDDLSYSAANGVLRILQARAVRGYAVAFQKLQQTLSAHFPPLEENEKIIRLLQLGDQNAGDYSSKLVISLDKDQSALDAAGLVFNALLQKMMMNIDGIKKDIDAEFLHDFRVSIRRTRTAQGQFKEFLPQGIIQQRQNFSWLAKKSNDLRDLDVYLERRAYYESLLPASLLEGAAILFTELQMQREQQLAAFCRILDSKKFQNMIASWRRFLQRCESSKVVQPKALVFAQNTIRTRYDKVLALGTGIDKQTPSKKLHKLRIECKKLRYLLEFFSSLFPQKNIKTAIDHLKELQDYLGALNDFAIQQSYLNSFLQRFPGKNDKHLLAVAAIGALIGQLYREQQQMFKKFDKVFGRFTGKTNAAIFKSLLENEVEK